MSRTPFPDNNGSLLIPEHTKPTVGRREVFVCRPTKFSQCVLHCRLKLVLVCFFRPIRYVESASELFGQLGHLIILIGCSDGDPVHEKKCRTDMLLGVLSLVCQGNFGPIRCRREPTPQSAFFATSSLAWCLPGFKWALYVQGYFFSLPVLEYVVKCYLRIFMCSQHAEISVACHCNLIRASIFAQH